MFPPAEAHNRRSEGEAGCGAEQIPMRMAVILVFVPRTMVKVQQNGIGFALAHLQYSLLRGRNLMNAIPCLIQNFLQDITKSFVWIDQQDMLELLHKGRTCQDLLLLASAYNQLAHTTRL